MAAAAISQPSSGGGTGGAGRLSRALVDLGEDLRAPLEQTVACGTFAV